MTTTKVDLYPVALAALLASGCARVPAASPTAVHTALHPATVVAAVVPPVNVDGLVEALLEVAEVADELDARSTVDQANAVLRQHLGQTARPSAAQLPLAALAYAFLYQATLTKTPGTSVALLRATSYILSHVEPRVLRRTRLSRARTVLRRLLPEMTLGPDKTADVGVKPWNRSTKPAAAGPTISFMDPVGVVVAGLGKHQRVDCGDALVATFNAAASGSNGDDGKAQLLWFAATKPGGRCKALRFARPAGVDPLHGEALALLLQVYKVPGHAWRGGGTLAERVDAHLADLRRGRTPKSNKGGLR